MWPFYFLWEIWSLQMQEKWKSLFYLLDVVCIEAFFFQNHLPRWIVLWNPGEELKSQVNKLGPVQSG